MHRRSCQLLKTHNVITRYFVIVLAAFIAAIFALDSQAIAGGFGRVILVFPVRSDAIPLARFLQFWPGVKSKAHRLGALVALQFAEPKIPRPPITKSVTEHV